MASKPEPNPTIDKAIKRLLAQIESEPAEIAVKVLAQAIAWEKVKHHIRDDGGFNPEDM